MKSNRIVKSVLAAICFSAFTQFAMAGVCDRYWEFSKSINLPDSSKNIAAVGLDQDVYNSAKPGLGDLKVIDSSGAEVPYAISMQDEVKDEKRVLSKIVSKEVTETESILTKQLVEPVIVYNSIVIIPDCSNFMRKITIEGSNDSAKWDIIRKEIAIYSFAFEMRDAYITRYTNETYASYGYEKFSGANLSIQFPEVSYKYVRVRIPHDLDKEPVAIANVEIYRTIKVSAEEGVYIGRVVKLEPDPSSKATDTMVDFGAKNLGIKRLEVATGQSNFFRNIEILASYDMKEWHKIGSGSIFSVALDGDAEKSLKIDFSPENRRYMKVKIFNGDNMPIKLSSVQGYGLQRFLVFMPAKGAGYTLFYGNPSANAPSYDLGAMIRDKPIADFSRGTLADKVRNEKFIKIKESKPWIEDKPYFLWIVLLIMTFGLIYLGSQVIKKSDDKAGKNNKG
jgi:hypothetical protein